MPKITPHQAFIFLLQIFLGGIMVIGGIMHFTQDPVSTYQNSFLTALYDTGYIWPFIGLVELVCGAAILVRRGTSLALIVLALIILAIFAFHVSEIGQDVLHPGGIYIGTPVLLAHLALAWHYRSYYR
jgi:putative oxidoreductase